MLYQEKLNIELEEISNYMQKENNLVLSEVSGNIAVYLPLSKQFIISNEIFDNLNSWFLEQKNIIVSNLKSLNKKIPIIKIIKKYNLWKNIIDIDGLYYSKYGKAINNNILKEYNNNWEKYLNIYNNFKKSRYTNTTIPLPILYDLEFQKSICNWYIFNKYKSWLSSNEYNAYLLRTIAFNTIENNGIYLEDKIVYPKYFIDHSYTGRVSCSYKKINFMALDKKSIINEQITSRFKDEGILYNFDFDSFHPRIIFNLLNNPIPYDQNGHKYLSEKYFNIEKETYNEIKQKIFKMLYGGNIKNNELSEIIENFKSKIDLLKTNLGRWIQDIEERLKLNYFIQKYEVDLMTESILKINKLLENYNSKLILYQYDSLIFDIHKKEEKDIIDKIKDIMENINNMKFKVKIKTGKTLKEIR